MVWAPESFAVAQSKEGVKPVEIPGYEVTAEQEAAILRCLEETLLIDPENAKVLPVSSFDRVRVGKRISAHPLHDTFLGPARKQERIAFYQRTDPGTLVADLDEGEAPDRVEQRDLFTEPVQRVQRVFTMPLKDLETAWTAAASQRRQRKPMGGQS